MSRHTVHCPSIHGSQTTRVNDVPSFGPLMVSGSVDEIFPSFGTPTTIMSVYSTPAFQISPELATDRFFENCLSSRNSSLLQSHSCGTPLQNESGLLHSPGEVLSATTQIPSNDFDGILQAGTAVFDVLLQGDDSDRPSLKQTPESRDHETLQLPTVYSARPFLPYASASYSPINREARLQSSACKVDQTGSVFPDKPENIKLGPSGVISEADASIQNAFESIGLPVSWHETGNIDISSIPAPGAQASSAYTNTLRSPVLAQAQSSSIFMPHVQSCSNPTPSFTKFAHTNQKTFQQSHETSQRSIPGQERSADECQPQNLASLDGTYPPWSQNGSLFQSLANLYPSDLRRKKRLEKSQDPKQPLNIAMPLPLPEHVVSTAALKRRKHGLAANRQTEHLSTPESEHPALFPDLENIFSEPTSSLRAAVTNPKRCKRDGNGTLRESRKERLVDKDNDQASSAKSGTRARSKTGASQSSRVNSPSHFCHICTRADRSMPVALCGNFSKGKCRKVVCAKCARDNGWADALAVITNPAVASEWSCVHCRGLCPFRAQCNTYGRINKLRREKRMNAAENSTVSPKEHPASEVTEDWVSFCQPQEGTPPAPGPP